MNKPERLESKDLERYLPADILDIVSEIPPPTDVYIFNNKLYIFQGGYLISWLPMPNPTEKDLDRMRTDLVRFVFN